MPVINLNFGVVLSKQQTVGQCGGRMHYSTAHPQEGAPRHLSPVKRCSVHGPPYCCHDSSCFAVYDAPVVLGMRRILAPNPALVKFPAGFLRILPDSNVFITVVVLRC